MCSIVALLSTNLFERSWYLDIWWLSLSWDEINKDIRECKRSSPNPHKVIDCLIALIDKYGRRDGMIIYEIAVQYEALGMYDRAMEYYREAMELFPLPKYKEIAREDFKRVLERVEQEQSKREVRTDSPEDVIVVDDDTLFVVNCTKRKVWSIARELGFKVSKKCLQC